MKRAIVQALAGAGGWVLGRVADVLFGAEDGPPWCPYCGYACGCRGATK